MMGEFRNFMEVTPKVWPWRVWQDGLTKDAVEKLFVYYQKNQPVPEQEYEFKIAPTQFHGEGFWQLEGRRIR